MRLLLNGLVALPTAVAFCLSTMPTCAHAGPEKTANEYFRGKVVPLEKIIEKEGTHLDADAVPYWLALVTEEGKTYPLIKDDGSRMFFLDKALLDRPVRLTGRLVKNSNLLQVVNVHSYEKGVLHEVYYWCDVCNIRRSEKKICECCGGPMELRLAPVKK
ncbi:MAG: hypothetical protein ACJ8FY_22175 [Gemmataceae bacterium]